MKSESSAQKPYVIMEPVPASLVESLRSFGYTLSTAIADLIDNSIAATAKNVWIDFEWDGLKSRITIKDDGKGMTESNLKAAMRPGSRNPIEDRDSKDLGRFGLGLKTASFSQCRKLTVISRVMKGSLASYCWDLDYISQTKEWRLQTINAETLDILQENIPSSGTIILWQKLDRVTDHSDSNDDKAYARFLEDAENVKQHLEMVFHRYLERPNELKIWINGHSIIPWDPFMRREEATQELPKEKLICNGKEFSVLPYILPHQSKTSLDTHQRASGPKGWNAQQGFYVYRNKRLLIGGDWLGLGFKKEEHYKLARIQIDLPNSMDEEWQIDVKKSRAKLPGYLKADLKKIARLTRERAMDVYRHRGKITARQNSQNYIFLWEQRIRHNKFYYLINREHPFVQQVYQSANKAEFDILLRMLEETIPISQILISNNIEPEQFNEPYKNIVTEDLTRMFESCFRALLNSGINIDDAKKRLMNIEPFNLLPDIVEQLSNKITQEKK